MPKMAIAPGTRSTPVFVFCITAALVAAVVQCSPRRSVPLVRAENERLRLGPLVDRSGLYALPGWPADTLHQSVLMRHFGVLRENALIEFRRCEKLGHYRMTDDSSAATLHVALTALPHRYANDTLQIDVEMVVRGDDGSLVFSTTLTGAAPAPNPRPDDRFQEIGLLLSAYCRAFPYRGLVAHFHSGLN